MSNTSKSWRYDDEISLRDWFAGMALQGLLANSGYALFEAEEQSIGDITDHANRIASIMISTRTKGGEA